MNKRHYFARVDTQILLLANAVPVQQHQISEPNALITLLARAVIQNFSQFVNVDGMEEGKNIAMLYQEISHTLMREMLFDNTMMLLRIVILPPDGDNVANRKNIISGNVKSYKHSIMSSY